MKLSAFDNRLLCFVLAIIFQLAAFVLMAFDPVPHGFGILTLWIGPILLISGILFPAIGLTKRNSLKEWATHIKSEPIRSAGFLASFVISFTTYLLTLEPTASFWDCSETIAAAYKLQVPHTPGTPLTLLIARLFSMLALGDVYQVAWMVNLMSASFSALAVGFLFLIAWYFGSKLFHEKWVLFIGSLGGVLCLAFSDSFWFSAVEAETYGPSVFFMVFLIWLSIQGSMLEERDRKRGVLLLSYLIGLSYCIHPMCILVLPVCILIWRFRTYPENWKQIVLSIALGIGCILFISKIIAVAFFEWAFKLDLFLVNQMSLPFYSGVFLLLFALLVAIIFTWMRYKKSRLILASIVMLIAGFSPYLMLFIRSSQLPPINEFSPGNLAKIKPYMNRESYPDRPLLYGPYFDTEINGSSTKALSYVVDGDRYTRIGEIPKYHYDEERMTLLPRIYSNEPAHIATYRRWTGLSAGEKPRFRDNMTFMFRYQLGHMFGRYFMWNFAGRASDIQHADWLAPWQGSIDRSLIDYSKASNQYYMLPFLLGLLGIIVQYKRDKKNFIANLSFFLLTGFLLVIYLNATPNEPRERDYIYVGSYAAFCVWIGLGIMSISQITRNWKIPYISGLVTICIPIWIFYQNLDDHDRSDRTYQIDHARNLLASCEKGAILFTGGDNDTFPLWYLQEVEGYRTDVRVKVLSYFNADWYINQLSRQYYDSAPFSLTLKSGENQYGPYDPLYIHETIQSPISWGKYINALKDENPQLLVQSSSGGEYYFLPSRQINLSTTKGMLHINVAGSYLPKSELAILDVLYSNDWSRPMYFNSTSLNSLNIDLKPYLSQEGLVYKLTPEKRATDEIQMNLGKSYENLVQGANYSNLSNSNVYFNHEDFQARMITPLKFTFNQLINGYAEKGDMEKVNELAFFAYENLYFDHLEPSYADIQLASFLDALKKTRESKKLVKRVFSFFHEKIENQLENDEMPSRNDLFVLQESSRLLEDPGSSAKYQELVIELKKQNNY